MRKVNPPSTTSGDPYAPAPTMHSPLSPLTPTSPLYPDGLIAPIWIRKHAELVPSVFVLFLRLYESPIHDVVEEMTAEAARARDEDERRKEKENDELLVKEIGERRKKLGERGIKLTVVLIASAATLGWLCFSSTSHVLNIDPFHYRFTSPRSEIILSSSSFCIVLEGLPVRPYTCASSSTARFRPIPTRCLVRFSYGILRQTCSTRPPQTS